MKSRRIHKTLAIFKSHKQWMELIYTNKTKDLGKLENILGKKCYQNWFMMRKKLD